MLRSVGVRVHEVLRVLVRHRPHRLMQVQSPALADASDPIGRAVVYVAHSCAHSRRRVGYVAFYNAHLPAVVAYIQRSGSSCSCAAVAVVALKPHRAAVAYTQKRFVLVPASQRVAEHRRIRRVIALTDLSQLKSARRNAPCVPLCDRSRYVQPEVVVYAAV